MKIRINSPSDELIVAQLAGLQSYKSLAELCAAYISIRCTDPEENFTADIAKALLPETYRSNPSAFAARLLSKVPDFADCAGYQTPDKHTHVTIRLLRERKPTTARYTRAAPSVKALIKEWLPLADQEPSFKLESDLIPFFFRTHPEQLSYQVKRETGTPIRIMRTETHWIITLK